MNLAAEHILPADADDALLVGRLWQPGIGPTVVVCSDGALFDITRVAPTVSQLLELPAPAGAVRDALIPSIDQTKTTGLVVLPGAFVGAIFGGISPLEAGRFQIVVLAAIMAAGSVAAVLIALWMGDVRTRPKAVLA